MGIEAIVQKYKEDAPLCSYDFDQSDAETMLRAALNELAAEYEQKQALLLDAHCERVNLLQERIRQLEAEQAVPVVGDVYWMRKDKLERVKSSGAMLCEVYADEQDGLVPMTLQHTTSITIAELERLRKCESVLIDIENGVGRNMADIRAAIAGEKDGT